MHFNPDRQFGILKEQLPKTLHGLFPVTGKVHRLVLKRVIIDDTLSPYDIHSQKSVKLQEGTWAVPVYGEFELQDIKTGQVLDTASVKIITLPKITNRFSYIVQGKEYEIQNMFRLKAGIYNRITDSGELEAQVNASQGRGFKVLFDPASRKFQIKYGTRHIMLYPILKVLGIADADIFSAWGKDIMAANQVPAPEREIAKLAEIMRRPRDTRSDVEVVLTTLESTVIRADTTILTLGKSFKSTEGEALLRTSTRMLNISRQKEKPDDRDSLVFKELYSIEDYLDERLHNSIKEITRRIHNNLDRKVKVRDIVSTDILNKPVQAFFTSTSVSAFSDQTNPVASLSGQTKTTIMGEGGVQSGHAITTDAKLINPSHLGFLDPIKTPESEKAGVVLQLAMGAKKVGKDLVTTIYNRRTKKLEEVTPLQMYEAYVAYPDQFKRIGAGFHPVANVVKASYHGEIVEVASDKIDFVIPSSKAILDLGVNLLPFLHHNQGNRIVFAAKQLDQAVSLVHREAPLIQTATETDNSFEEVVGKFQSHKSPVDGVVTAITPNAIMIKAGGQTHKVALYSDFPLNDQKTVMNSYPLVKVGDAVKAGQVIADNNFTKNGVLAIGTNLRYAYMPYLGYNYDDGTIISESTSRKLTSEHMYRITQGREDIIVLNLKKFMAYFPGELTATQAQRYDEDGIIKKGEVVEHGDHLICVLRKGQLTAEAKALQGVNKSLVKPYQNRTKSWEYDFPGTVAEVVKLRDSVSVHIRTNEPAIVGDKLSARHANKNIISMILPDNEMPRDKEGKPVDVIFNPLGVPSRMNLGQLLELGLSKVVRKTGEPIKVSNFSGIDYTEHTVETLKKHGFDEDGREELFDSASGKSLGRILTGEQYTLKLQHQVAKKLSSRSRDAYDVNMIPKGGGKHAGQRLGELGNYGILAHGATENLRDMLNYKSQRNDDYWFALQTGEPLPPPKPAFAFKKFEGYLNSLGLNLEKQGHSLTLTPMTNAEILRLSNGEIKDPGLTVRAKDLREEAGGLFDPKITGGVGASKWAHITLAEPMPNPVFEEAILFIAGITGVEYHDILAGKKKINGKSGGEAIQELLRGINVDTELARAEEDLKITTSMQKVDKLHRKVKILRALKAKGLTPEVYMLQHMPVLPPVFRPLTQLDDGNINFDDLNGLYKDMGLINGQLRTARKVLPESEVAKLRVSLYDAMKATSGVGAPTKYVGVLQKISTGGGEKGQPKYGFFQDKLLKRKQDLTARSTVIPEPKLGIDEIGVPEAIAWGLYEPMIVRELYRLGYTPLDAQKKVKERAPAARQALTHLMDDTPLALDRMGDRNLEVARSGSTKNITPLLMKRDPVLHKFGIMAFRPRLVSGKAIRVSPLITSGYNMDFDGDTASLFLPSTKEAIEEAHRMFPSNNLFSPTRGSLMNLPGQEAQLGLFTMSRWGTNVGKRYPTIAAAVVDADAGRIKYYDVVTVNNRLTTVGRLKFVGCLPEEMQKWPKDAWDPQKFLSDTQVKVDKKFLDTIMTLVAKAYPAKFPEVSHKLMLLGNRWAYEGEHTLSLKDLRVDKKERDALFAAADKKVQGAKNLTPTQRDKLIVEAYTAASGDALKARVEKDKVRPSDDRNYLYEAISSGAKGKVDQYQQMVVSPGLVRDARGRVVPVPIRKSYSEGLDVGSYWTALHGARKGVIDKVQSTSDPGALTKEVVNSSMHMLVSDQDCHTTEGIMMPVSSKDALNRYTFADFVMGGKTVPRGTVTTPRLLSSAQAAGVEKIPVRSPLRCRAGKGVCAKCLGLDETGNEHTLGTNIGIIAAQAMGEPATQLALKTFHTGGSVAAASGVTDKMERVHQLLQMPRTLPGAATLSLYSGTVERIEKSPAGGWEVYVHGERHYVPGDRTLLVERGKQVMKGDALSSGPLNPIDLVELKGVEAVQNYLTNELHEAYGQEVRRKNMEVVVRSLTDLVKIHDAGDHEEFVRGDFAHASHVEQENKRLTQQGLKPVEYSSVMKGTNVFPLVHTEDWMARMNYRDVRKTVLEAAQEGHRSHIHGGLGSPIPGMAYALEFGKPPQGTPGY